MNNLQWINFRPATHKKADFCLFLSSFERFLAVFEEFLLSHPFRDETAERMGHPVGA
jgi:hypothetical protein